MVGRGGHALTGPQYGYGLIELMELGATPDRSLALCPVCGLVRPIQRGDMLESTDRMEKVDVCAGVEQANLAYAVAARLGGEVTEDAEGERPLAEPRGSSDGLSCTPTSPPWGEVPRPTRS